MGNILYVYYFEKIDELKKYFANKRIISIASILNLARSVDDILDSDSDFVDDCIIDITTLGVENGYSRLFIERYLYALINNLESADYLIDRTVRDAFKRKFPFILNDINEDFVCAEKYNRVKEDCEPIEKINITPIPLLLYKRNLTNVLANKYLIVSIGSLLDGGNNYNFDSKTVEDDFSRETIKYIDITEFAQIIASNKDQVISFEVILRQIHNKNPNVKFLICEDMVQELKKYLPFTFSNNGEYLDSIVEEESHSNKEDLPLDVNISKIIESLNSKLKGHDVFKKDFEFNLKKFVLLNRIKQRKIFSIILIGESGIGKTEFAKILSECMYPNEKLIKINFGNYSDGGVLNSLIGSPLGYIGSEEGGELINKMKNSKSKVILIDEFEKATPSVFNFFYELLEDGKFTDRHGVEHDLDGYIIVFTSNMTKEEFVKIIPDPLKSRIDMKSHFVDISNDEKMSFIEEYAATLIGKINMNDSTKIQINSIRDKLNSLIEYKNLRDIKRGVEDIVINEYYGEIEKEPSPEPAPEA